LNMRDGAKAEFLRTILDAIPSLVFVVDDDVRIQEYNAAAAEQLTVQRSLVLIRRGGEVLYCLNAAKTPEGLDTHPPVRIALSGILLLKPSGETVL